MRTDMRTLLSLLLVSAVVSTGCGGESTESADPSSASPLPEERLTVNDPWIRPAPKGAVSALYMTLVNGTPSPDTLRSVGFALSDSVEIHETIPMEGEDGMSGMREIGPLPVAPRSRVQLVPGGKHIMLMGLRESLSVGDTLTVRLHFSDTGPRRLQVPVQAMARGTMTE